MNNWFVGYTGLERRDLCMKPLNNTMTKLQIPIPCTALTLS